MALFGKKKDKTVDLTARYLKQQERLSNMKDSMKKQEEQQQDNPYGMQQNSNLPPMPSGSSNMQSSPQNALPQLPSNNPNMQNSPQNTNPPQIPAGNSNMQSSLQNGNIPSMPSGSSNTQNSPQNAKPESNPLPNFGFLDNVASSQSSQSQTPTNYGQYNQQQSYPYSQPPNTVGDPGEKSKSLSKKLMDITGQLEEISNQLYHLQQRVELLEKKSGAGGYR